MAYFRRKRWRKTGISRAPHRRHDPAVDGIAPSAATLRKYGITAAEYIAMYTEQDGGCYICGRPPVTRRLAIDHCHKNQQVRGILCATHNYALGVFRDNPQHLRRAAEYLERPNPILRLRRGVVESPG